MLDEDAVGYVHFAPPNGTSSAARNSGTQDRGALRSDEFPNGLPELADDQRKAVDKDNKLYHHVAALVVLLAWKGVLWSVESPASSYLWDTSPFKCLLDLSTIGAISVKRTNPLVWLGIALPP